jgi:hypothetical protein
VRETNNIRKGLSRGKRKSRGMRSKLDLLSELISIRDNGDSLDCFKGEKGTRRAERESGNNPVALPTASRSKEKDLLLKGQVRDRREHTARISPVVDCICRICKRTGEKKKKKKKLTSSPPPPPRRRAKGRKRKKQTRRNASTRHTHTRETGADGMKKPESLSLALSSTVHTYIVCVCLFYPDSLIRFSSFVCAQHRGNI